MAWLHSAPKLHEKDKEPKVRLKTLSEDSPARVLPEANDFITSCFEMLGLCLNGSMGSIPLTWSEVNAFCNSSGYKLNGWESEQLIKMSRDYCYMLSKGKSVDCPAPYQKGFDTEEELKVMRERVNKQWDSFN